MKLGDMVMVVENHKGTETNFLLNLTDYMEAALKLWGEHAEDMAGVVSTLYETKAGKKDWSDLYFAANKSIHASFCTGEAQLRGFLAGNFNDGEWSFDEGRCSGECLEVLRIYNLKTDGHSLFPYLHHERVEHTFHAGEALHNMNGNDYRVLAALSPDDLLVMSLTDSQIIVGRGVKLYERYPKGERPDDESVVTGIEWDHGVYLGQDITRNDSFAVGNVSVVEGKNGMFVAMPSYKAGNRYRDVCFPITKEFREKINDAVLETYQQAKEQAMQEGKERASQQMQTDDRGFMKVSGEPLPFR
mgnify:CR=1 FL=1